MANDFKIAELSQFDKLQPTIKFLFVFTKLFFLNLSKLLANKRINFLWNYAKSRNDNWEYFDVIDMIAQLQKKLQIASWKTAFNLLHSNLGTSVLIFLFFFE